MSDRGFDRWVDELRANPPARTPIRPGAERAKENAEKAVAHDPVALASASEEARESRRWHRRLRLSPNLEVFEALSRGEAVPVSRLDPEWVERYGLREGQGSGYG